MRAPPLLGRLANCEGLGSAPWPRDHPRPVPVCTRTCVRATFGGLYVPAKRLLHGSAERRYHQFAVGDFSSFPQTLNCLKMPFRSALSLSPKRRCLKQSACIGMGEIGHEKTSKNDFSRPSRAEAIEQRSIARHLCTSRRPAALCSPGSKTWLRHGTETAANEVKLSSGENGLIAF